MEFVQQLMDQNTALTKQVSEMNDTIRELNQTIKELKEQLNKNSKNSSKPPSSDGLKKPPVNKNRSLRQKSGKKQGAQKGHDGTCLSVVADPDFVESHMHSDCVCCPYHDSCLDKACIKETRHEIDAEVVVNVTAHQLVVVSNCPLHNCEKAGSFPSDIKATVQYGKNLQSMVVAFNTVGAVSINRTHEILSSVFNIPLSTGTIKNMVTQCADVLKPTYKKICHAVMNLGLIHCDETGTRVDGKTWWVHDVSDMDYTYLSIQKKRGHLGMDAIGILPSFHGIAVHDCWASYWKYPDVEHAVCCAHLLHELNGIIENYPEQTWAPQFKELLLAIKKVRDKALANGKDELSYYHLHKFDRKYE